MKRMIAVCLSLLLMMTAVPHGAAAATTGTIGNITYEIEGGQVTITGYNVAVPADLIIPDTIKGYPVTAIGAGAFEDAACSSVTIPDSVLSIGKYAFAWCTFLKTATIGNGVATIGYGAFSYTGLTTVSIGSGVSNIDDHTFMSCSKMTAITVAEDNPYYCTVDGVLYNKPVTRLIYYPGGKAGAFVFPDTVTSYVNGAFDFCNTITSVTLPAGLTAFSTGSFYKCTALGSIHVAADNPYIRSHGGVVFSKDMSTLLCCPSGRWGVYVVPEQVTTIARSAFEHCEYLSTLIIPNNVTKIEDSAFAYCHKLTSVTIPDSVTEIGEHLFYDCNNLASVTIGKGITDLPTMTFYDCGKLTDIHLPDTLTHIGTYAFKGSGYANDVANRRNGALFYGTYLIYAVGTVYGEYVVPEDTTLIADYAFHGSDRMTAVVIPEGIRSIGFSTFSRCAALKSVTLPSTLSSVGEHAFSYCSALADVHYGGTEKDKGGIAIADHNSPLTDAVWHCAVSEGIPGDGNGDGKVNNRDLGLLQQYLNEWDVEIDLTVMDVNRDERVNNRDLGLLQQYLNGWDVEIG